MAQKLNLVIDQGTTYVFSFNVTDENNTPINFDGYTCRSSIKKSYTSTKSIPFSVQCTNSGLVTLSMNAETTTVFSAGRYVYDVEAINLANEVIRVVAGRVTITPEVTT